MADFSGTIPRVKSEGSSMLDVKDLNAVVFIGAIGVTWSRLSLGSTIDPPTE